MGQFEQVGHGISFTPADSNSFLSPHKILKNKYLGIF